MTFGIVLFGWIFSLCLHEFSHALVAYYGGDYTVREKGYLTFNPLKYTHPLFSILLPMLFLVLGGIVGEDHKLDLGDLQLIRLLIVQRERPKVELPAIEWK